MQNDKEPKAKIPKQAYDHLENMPAPKPAKVGSTVTLGDLHGNAMKLIWFLIREGAISMSLDNYKRLWDIYEDSMELSEDNAKEFIAILNNIKIENSKFRARFIGDMFADRGNNDYLTLKVLELIGRAEIKTEIIYSNHDALLLASYQMAPAIWQVDYLGENQEDSMEGLVNYIRTNPEPLHKEVVGLIDQYVLPNLKLISYSLSPDGKQIDIFMHAPNNYQDLIKIAEKYVGGFIMRAFKENLSPKATELAQLFDIINKSFLGQINELVPEQTIDIGFIWNRLETGDGNIDMDSYPDCVNHIVHGHTESGRPHPMQINIDTPFGKILEPFEDEDTQLIYLPIYKTFVLEEHTLKDLEKLEEEEKKVASPPTVNMLTLMVSNSPPTEKTTPDSMKTPTPTPEPNIKPTGQKRPNSADQPDSLGSSDHLFNSTSPPDLDSNQEPNQPSGLTKK